MSKWQLYVEHTKHWREMSFLSMLFLIYTVCMLSGVGAQTPNTAHPFLTSFVQCYLWTLSSRSRRMHSECWRFCCCCGLSVIPTNFDSSPMCGTNNVRVHVSF